MPCHSPIGPIYCFYNRPRPTMLLIFLLLLCLHSSASINETSSAPIGNEPYWVIDPERLDSVTANHQPKLNDPCDFRMYLDFNKDVAQYRESATPYDKAVGKKYFDHPHALQTKPKVMDPKYLCIRTDAEKNIDINEFDCIANKLDVESVAGYCGCGNHWSTIDLNDKNSYLGLNTTSHSYNYLALSRLDKFLIVEKDDNDEFHCVAHRFGHCTLSYYTKRPGWNITRCKRGYKCRNISVWSPIQKTAVHNLETDEWYGVCISETTPDGLMDPHGFADKPDIHLVVLVGGLLLNILICQNYCHFKIHVHDCISERKNKRRNNKCLPQLCS